MSDKKGFIRKACAVISVALLTASVSYAQPKAAGATFSFKGISLSYEHCMNDSFLEASLKAETAETFLYRSECPGISGSLTWNFRIREWISSEGNTITVFAGPGLIAGYGPDFKRQSGLFYGLKGRAGIECDFERNVVISLAVSPIIGSHIVFHTDHISMNPYLNGLIYSVLPEIGIKYRF